MLGRPRRLLGEHPGPAISFSTAGEEVWAALCGDESDIGIDVAGSAEFQVGYPVHRVFDAQEHHQALEWAGGDLGIWISQEHRKKRMAHAFNKTTFNASADAIWQVIGDFGAACQYLAGVVNCTVEGEGVGARRTLTSADGNVIIERLDNSGMETWHTGPAGMAAQMKADYAETLHIIKTAKIKLEQ